MPVSPILSGRFGIVAWGIQPDKETLPTEWNECGLIRDVRVRVPAGTELIRGVGMLSTAGVTVVETAIPAVDITLTYEGVGMPFKPLAQAGVFRPGTDQQYPYQLPLVAILFGDVYRGRFVAIDGKVTRVDLDCPADRVVTGTITISARRIDPYTGDVPSISLSEQVFIGKEGRIAAQGGSAEALEFRLRVAHRVDARHVIKPTAGSRVPDYLIETTTDVSVSMRVFWHAGLGDFDANALSPADISFTLQDFADSSKTMTVVVTGAKVREATKAIPAEREIEVDVEYISTNWSIS
jgi:hypothetical protein